MCFIFSFSLDGVYEDTESLAFDLMLGGTTTNVNINPSVTEIFILDSDGKNNDEHLLQAFLFVSYL